jgi:hypothetical protein
MRTLLAGILLFAAMPLGIASAQLRGSESSMERQHRVAIRNDLSFMGTRSEVRQFVRRDRLVPVRSSRTLLVKDVSYAYARPQVALFLQRLAADYYAAAHEQLVVTSLVRPITEQPHNASPLSVHPAGMAVDLRIPDTWEHRRWLENHLLALERRSVLDVTLEYHPAHYHVAVFPTEYMQYAAQFSAPRVTAKKLAAVSSRPTARVRAHPVASRAATSVRRGAAATSTHRAASLKGHATRRVQSAAHATRRVQSAGHAARRVQSAAHAGRRERSHGQSARKATTGSRRAARAAG